MSEAEWALIAPHLPAGMRLGRPRRVPLRGVVEALLYLLRTTAPCRLLPRNVPNRSTAQRYFYAWRRAGLWKTINWTPPITAFLEMRGADVLRRR